jgi:hypothetical protein
MDKTSITVAVIAGLFNVIVVIAGRWLSHLEHKKTACDVREIKAAVNGKTLVANDATPPTISP